MKQDTRVVEIKWILEEANVERAVEHQEVDIVSDDNTHNDVNGLDNDSLFEELSRVQEPGSTRNKT